MLIRCIKNEDIETVLAIYRPYVENTAISFEYKVPSLESFAERVHHYTTTFPWLVAEENGKILGYAYASLYRTRIAYQWDCELSVYVDMAAKGRHIGKQLYGALLDIVKMQGFYNAYGVITWPNETSYRLHKHFGFILNGIQPNSGYKLGKWHDMAYMSKPLRSYDRPEKAPAAFPELLKSDIDVILKKYSDS